MIIIFSRLHLSIYVNFIVHDFSLATLNWGKYQFFIYSLKRFLHEKSKCSIENQKSLFIDM